MTPTPTLLATRTPVPAQLPQPSPAFSVELADRPPALGSPLADLAVQGPGSVELVPGGTSRYTLTLRNRGPDLATGIVLTDVFPRGVMPVWPLCGQKGRSVACDLGDWGKDDALSLTLDLSSGRAVTLATGSQLTGLPVCAIESDASLARVVCRLTRLEPGADVQLPIGLETDARITGTLAHTVTVAANQTDTDRSNDRATFSQQVGAARPVVTAVPTATDLLVYAEGPSTVIAGQPFTYTFIISNQGPLDASGLRFENALPPATVLHDYAPGSPRCQQRGDALTCYLQDLDSGETLSFTLLITGHAGLPMKMSLDPLMPGWPICSLLKERTYLHIVNCELGALKRGQATRVQVGLVAEGVQERMMANTGSVSANQAELTPWDNTYTTTVAIQVRSDLELRSDVSGPAVPGERLTYTLSLANLGPSDAAGVVLTDTLPALVGEPEPLDSSLVSAVASQGDDCQMSPVDTPGVSGSQVVCQLGRLGSGETASVTVVVLVDESLREPLVHAARVAAKSVDPDLDNNALSQSIPIRPGAED